VSFFRGVNHSRPVTKAFWAAMKRRVSVADPPSQNRGPEGAPFGLYRPPGPDRGRPRRSYWRSRQDLAVPSRPWAL
jgi:hypothetical protein